jgi:hypothetical protein
MAIGDHAIPERSCALNLRGASIVLVAVVLVTTMQFNSGLGARCRQLQACCDLDIKVDMTSFVRLIVVRH